MGETTSCISSLVFRKARPLFKNWGLNPETRPTPVYPTRRVFASQKKTKKFFVVFLLNSATAASSSLPPRLPVAAPTLMKTSGWRRRESRNRADVSRAAETPSVDPCASSASLHTRVTSSAASECSHLGALAQVRSPVGQSSPFENSSNCTFCFVFFGVFFPRTTFLLLLSSFFPSLLLWKSTAPSVTSGQENRSIRLLAQMK